VIALDSAWGAGTHSLGDVTGAAGRTVRLEAHGVVPGEIRLFGSQLHGSSDELFLDELARRSAIALVTARTFRDLHNAINAREEFLSAAGHELRAPLTTLKLSMYDLQRFSGSDVSVAEKQIARLERLIERLLDVTQLSAGRLELALEEVDLFDLVRDVVRGFEGGVPARTIDVRTTGELRGRWDRLRISQVVANLVSNAVKYGGESDVGIELAGDLDAVRMLVRDRGIGIPADAQSRIFDRFERAVPRHEYGGVGVGLWICRRIVEAHGGAIQVESAEGLGSTFIVNLPRVTVQPPGV
jgi:signal transduction histidine kinase